MDNFIVRLRRYLEANPRFPKHLHTVRGAGYRLVLGTEPAAAGVGHGIPRSAGA